MQKLAKLAAIAALIMLGIAAFAVLLDLARQGIIQPPYPQ